jgi:UDP-N-acetylmuramate: L-alanyl-gamma-D-glutamyl-meso-diaminopimelate ligase
LLDEVAGEAKSGDVILVMSNGSFGGFIDSLLKRLGGAT